MEDSDVAISFVNQDLAVASALRDSLGESLEVFVYSSRQDEVAGTDGLETFREVFRHRAKLVVILLRDTWGKTPWTRVEMEAVTDRFLKEGPSFLFVIMMDDAVPPPWLPDKLIRFSFKDFGLEQAVGAIKARALEQGSAIAPPSAAFLAKRSEERARFGRERERLFRTTEGVQHAESEARRLMKIVEAYVDDALQAAPSLGAEFGAAETCCVLKTAHVAVRLAYSNRVMNVLDEAELELLELQGSVILPGQNAYYRRHPQELAKWSWKPDVAPDKGWCWRGDNDVLSTSEEVADRLIRAFFELVDRHSSGKLPPRSSEW